MIQPLTLLSLRAGVKYSNPDGSAQLHQASGIGGILSTEVARDTSYRSQPILSVSDDEASWQHLHI